VGNRYADRLRRHLAPMVQDGLVSVDATGPFTEIARRCWSAAVAAYSRSHYDPQDLRRALADGDGDGDPRVALNDARVSDGWPDLPDVDGAELDALRGQTRITHLFSQERVDVRFFVEVLSSSDGLCLTLLTDTRYVPSDTVPDILRSMEARLIDEARAG